MEESDARIPACSYICEMTHGYQNEVFENMIKCFMDNQCMSHYPRDGICKGEDKDGVQSITSLDQVRGDWWVVRGLNCGHGDYPGGYDGKDDAFCLSLKSMNKKQLQKSKVDRNQAEAFIVVFDSYMTKKLRKKKIKTLNVEVARINFAKFFR